MTYRMHWALLASLSAAALMLAANETFARSGAAPGGGVPSAHPIFRPSAAHSFRHHRRNFVGGPVGGYYYAPSNGESIADVTQPEARDIRYTYTYDVPWDWAHRYPPAVIPSERPYVPSCPAETVMVPGRDGKDQAVSIMRCY